MSPNTLYSLLRAGYCSRRQSCWKIGVIVSASMKMVRHSIACQCRCIARYTEELELVDSAGLKNIAKASQIYSFEGICKPVQG